MPPVRQDGSLFAFCHDVQEESVGDVLELGHFDVLVLVVQEVAFDVVDVVLEELAKDHLKVHYFVLEAAEEDEPQPIGSLEHVELVLVRAEKSEGGGVLDGRKGTAQPRHLHCRSYSVSDAIVLIEFVVVVYRPRVVGELAVVEQPVEVVEDEELVYDGILVGVVDWRYGGWLGLLSLGFHLIKGQAAAQ